MANIFFSGQKASKEDAEKSLMQHAAGIFDGRFHVRFESDDGGNHIVLILEVEEPSVPLPDFLRQSLHEPKWEGWRMMIKKVPPGYIDAIILAIKSDDY